MPPQEMAKAVGFLDAPSAKPLSRTMCTSRGCLSYEISGNSLLAGNSRRHRFVTMLASLHLIRLLRNALTLLRETTDERERDRLTCQLIADLQAFLAHSSQAGDAQEWERQLGESKPSLLRESLVA